MDMSKATASGSLTVAQLGNLLRMAAEIADADNNYDLLSALDALNKDRLRPAGLPEVYEAELRQIAKALLAEIPEEERLGGPEGEIAEVNVWLGQHVRAERFRSGNSPLADLLKTAADHSDASKGGSKHV